MGVCVCDVILRGQMCRRDGQAKERGVGEQQRDSVVGSMCVVCCEKESGGDHQ